VLHTLRCTSHCICSLFSTLRHSNLLFSSLHQCSRKLAYCPSHPTPLLSSPSPIPYNLEGKVSRLSYESPRIVLLKMLDGAAATLRTNFFNEDRYALSLRVSLSHTDSDFDSAVNLNLLLRSPPSNLNVLNVHHSRPVASRFIRYTLLS
jgi:hypothetical protein